MIKVGSKYNFQPQGGNFDPARMRSAQPPRQRGGSEAPTAENAVEKVP